MDATTIRARTFAVVRVVTTSIRAGVGPFHNVTPGGLHIHHLVWGIALLLVVGYLWLLEIGTATDSRFAARLTAVAFGVGAALTLDEFALWLDLRDVYWEHEGRYSVDAVLLFGALLMAWVWGAPLIHALVREGRAAIRLAFRLESSATHALSQGLEEGREFLTGHGEHDHEEPPRP